EQVAAVARGAEHVVLGASARARVEAARTVVERIIAEERVVYGVNTGFGKLSDYTIPPDELRELQLNLVRSHACGVGAPLALEEARAMMLLRANVLALGFSGARVLVIETLLAMLAQDVVPVVPEKGSVGASGDLAPLAHLALASIGEGEAFHRGARMSSAEALQRAGIEPWRLEGKEGHAQLLRLKQAAQPTIRSSSQTQTKCYRAATFTARRSRSSAITPQSRSSIS